MPSSFPNRPIESDRIILGFSHFRRAWQFALSVAPNSPSSFLAYVGRTLHRSVVQGKRCASENWLLVLKDLIADTPARESLLGLSRRDVRFANLDWAFAMPRVW